MQNTTKLKKEWLLEKKKEGEMWGTEVIFNSPYTICSFFTGKEENQEKKKAQGVRERKYLSLEIYTPAWKDGSYQRKRKRG